MKKFLLLLNVLFVLNAFTQSIPTPDYSHRFTGSLGHANFTIGSSITLTTDRFGYVNHAAFLAPNHGEFSLNIPATSTLKTQGTISFWYKHNSYGNSTINESRPMVYMHNGNSSFYEGIMLANSNETTPNKIRYASYRNSTIGIAGYSATNYNTTDWVHYAINYKFGTGGYYKIYVNGVLSDNISMNHEISDLGVNNKITFLGITSALGWSSLSGYLDDILVYNTNLTDAEINNIFLETYTNNIVQRSLLYKFDNTLYDHFGNHTLTTVGNFIYGNNNRGNENTVGTFNTGTGIGVSAKVPVAYNQELSGNQFSVAFAIKPKGIISEDGGMGSGDGIYRPIVVIPSTTSSNYSISERLYIGINFSNRRLVVRQNQQVLESSIQFISNEVVWTYITVTVDQNKIRLFVNGNLDGTMNLTSPLLYISSDRPISVAHMYNGTQNYYYRGWIDELLFAPLTYSATQASSMYNEYNSSGNTLGNTLFNNRENIKIYPNPTTGIVNLAEQANVQVFDIQGRMVLESKNVNQINLNDQNSGIYLLKLENEKGTSTQKIIKK